MTEQKMTMQQMLPNFEELFKAKAIKRIIVYVDADMDAIPHLTESTPDGVSHLREAYSYEALKADDTLVSKMSGVFNHRLSAKVQALMKSPLDNGVLGVFVISGEDSNIEQNESEISDFLNMRAGDIWDIVHRSCELLNSLNNKSGQIPSAIVRFFINDDDKPRVSASITPGHDNNANRESFIDCVTTAIPEFSDETNNKVTYVGMKCKKTNEYHVRYGFNHAQGKHLPTDDELKEDTDFGVNFVAPDSDGSEFAPDSKYFIKPEDWKSLMPKPIEG